jgi:hypothetical protein
MPQPYLVSDYFMVPIKPSTKYKTCWQVMDKEFYVTAMAVEKIQKPRGAPSSLSEAYRLREDEVAFHDLLTKWMNGSLILYRGFPGCHFCWPDLMDGKLISEGIEDKPTFTMGGARTRWLPAAEQWDLAVGPTRQCLDTFTRGLALHKHIPIGFTVKILAGSSRNVPLCWLNSGEIVVRGPLYLSQYHIESITWFRNEALSYTDWPERFSDLFLPPQRPFNPTNAIHVDEWWDACQVWMGEARRCIPGIR